MEYLSKIFSTPKPPQRQHNTHNTHNAQQLYNAQISYNNNNKNNNKNKCAGMMSIYKPRHENAAIAFGRAPRNSNELDHIYLNYNVALVVDLTEFSEREKYIDYRIHFQKEKANGWDISMKHYHLNENYDFQQNRAKSFCELINFMTQEHKKNRNIYIHCIDGNERSALVMGCLISNLYPSTTFESVMEILNNLHEKRTDYEAGKKPLKAIQVESNIELLRQYCEYQSRRVKRFTEKANKKQQKIKDDEKKIKDDEMNMEKCIDKYIHKKKYTIKRIGVNNDGSKLKSIRVSVV